MWRVVHAVLSAEVAKKAVQNLMFFRPKFGGEPQKFWGHLLIDTTSDLLAKFGWDPMAGLIYMLTE